jgi:hypothetical protein
VFATFPSAGVDVKALGKALFYAFIATSGLLLVIGNAAGADGPRY